MASDTEDRPRGLRHNADNHGDHPGDRIGLRKHPTADNGRGTISRNRTPGLRWAQGCPKGRPRRHTRHHPITRGMSTPTTVRRSPVQKARDHLTELDAGTAWRNGTRARAPRGEAHKGWPDRTRQRRPRRAGRTCDADASHPRCHSPPCVPPTRGANEGSPYIAPLGSQRRMDANAQLRPGRCNHLLATHSFILRAIHRGGCPGWGGQWPPSHPPRCGLSVWALLYPPESAPCMSCASA